MAARLVSGVNVRKQDHVTPTLKALHWLPIEKRIIFKILLMTFLNVLNVFKVLNTLVAQSS